MRYFNYLISIIIFVLAADAALAENSRYRVEVLVLTHLDHRQEPLEATRLEDFSSALDFLQPPDETEEAEAGAAPAVADEPVPAEDAVEESAEEVVEPDPWNVVTHVEEMGPEMAEAWRRLRLSAPFRPLQYLSWEQGSNAPFPLLRIHDLESILIEDPWAEQRLALEEAEAVPVFSDAAATEGAEDEDSSEALPDPINYYRLDGTVSLLRSRFLHLSVVAELREPVYAASPFAGVPSTTAAASAEPEAPRPSSFLVHRLEQSRPIRSGRMEYFDGPVLGVLAWVSDISDTVVEPEPE